MRHARLKNAGLVAAILLAACGGGGGNDADINPVPTPAPTPTPTPTPPTPVTLSVSRVFPNLTFSSPVAMLQAPADASRWFVVEQAGRVRAFSNDQTATATTTFIDIASRVTSGGEMGLLGLAFHPSFASNRRAFLYYTTTVSGALVSRLSEFTSADAGATLNPNSERVLLTINQPEQNHNGGGIAFGNDGFLYLGLGDGGGAGDAHGAIGNAQSLQTLLGKMVRIDVDTSTPPFNYAIPASNPFPGNPLCGNGGTTGSAQCPEIYAYGFRNPWRWSFDRTSGDLWVGDVGQNTLEEINRVVRGGNYGWRCKEATNTFSSNCGPAANLLDPVFQYGRSAGFSTTGGFVYRGLAHPTLRGLYVFADFGGRVWNFPASTAPTLTVLASDGLATNLQIASFGEDIDGELYIVNYAGTLHRVQVAN